MPVLSQRFGQTTIAKLSDPHELKQLLIDPWLQSETIIIKPNFVSTDPGYATDPEALRALLEVLDSSIVVTESHMVPRSTNLIDGGMNFTVGGEEVNWIWRARARTASQFPRPLRNPPLGTRTPRAR